jgi:hypothetical protein
MAELKTDDGKRGQSSLRDEIARRVAAKLAPEVGARLPEYVDRLIAMGDDAPDETPVYRGDASQVIAAASVLVSAIAIMIGRIDRYVDERRRAEEEARRRADEQHVRDERDQAMCLAESAIALTRDVLAHAVQQGVQFPEAMPAKVRIALVEEVVEEGLEQMKRLEGRR